MELLSSALLELRLLCQEGKSQQAWALSDALHNIPSFVMNPEKWKLEYFVEQFTRYEDFYPTAERCPPNDYLSYLSKLK
jgi:hypothetical protein